MARKSAVDDPLGEVVFIQRALTRFRRSRRAKMLRSMDELIAVAKKYAVSKYTRRSERAHWVRLSGQLIWYHDSILKNYENDAMRLELDELNQAIDRRDAARETGLSDPTIPALSPWQKRGVEGIDKQQEAEPGEDPFKDDAE